MTLSALISTETLQVYCPLEKSFKDNFSYSNTSNPAPRTFPVFIADTKSAVTTLFPLGVKHPKDFVKHLQRPHQPFD
jgi:hypothetical protein